MNEQCSAGTWAGVGYSSCTEVCEFCCLPRFACDRQKHGRPKIDMLAVFFQCEAGKYSAALGAASEETCTPVRSLNDKLLIYHFVQCLSTDLLFILVMCTER
jgi:hypothetical protein